MFDQLNIYNISNIVELKESMLVNSTSDDYEDEKKKEFSKMDKYLTLVSILSQTTKKLDKGPKPKTKNALLNSIGLEITNMKNNKTVSATIREYII